MLPAESEVHGLLALMLLQDARRGARFTAEGDLVLLEQQDREAWDAAAIEEGSRLAAEALRAGVGVYGLQAAIAAVHDHARQAGETDWTQIVGLYDVLLRLQPSPVVELNYAVAVAMERGAAAGLALIEALRGLDDYVPYWAAKGQMLLWSGQVDAAGVAYSRAQELALAAGDSAQERFFRQRLAQSVSSRPPAG